MVTHSMDMEINWRLMGFDAAAPACTSNETETFERLKSIVSFVE